MSGFLFHLEETRYIACTSNEYEKIQYEIDSNQKQQLSNPPK